MHGLHCLHYHHYHQHLWNRPRGRLRSVPSSHIPFYIHIPCSVDREMGGIHYCIGVGTPCSICVLTCFFPFQYSPATCYILCFFPLLPLHHPIFPAEKMGNTQGRFQTGRGFGKGKSISVNGRGSSGYMGNTVLYYSSYWARFTALTA